MNINQEQQNKLEKIFAKEGVIFAYLFGSQVSGKTVKDSDYDLAVMFNDEMDEKIRFEKRLKLMSELTGVFKVSRVDVIVLNDFKDILFKFVILQKGKVVYDDEHGARLNYEVRTMNDYYDFKPFLEIYNKAFSQRVLTER